MNTAYKVLWNARTHNYVVVSELAKGRCNNSVSIKDGVAGNIFYRFPIKRIAFGVLLTLGTKLFAAPLGGMVVDGSASIASSGNKTIITQSTPKAVINWQSFDVGAGQAVQFIQPNASSVALNRVIGSSPSNILGSISSNGQVFLINPNGILFAPGSSVNTGGFVASTLDISNTNFKNGNYQFSGNSAAGVNNQGTINADGAYVALLGAQVSNTGLISAKMGTVVLAAGKSVTLDLVGDGLLKVTVDQGAVNALVKNGGMIQADGGQVIMTTQSAGALLNTVVNNTGVIQAQTLSEVGGKIYLLGDMQSGVVNVGGTLDASAPKGGNGGKIETSAATVNIANNAKVSTLAPSGKTGEWLVDPGDFNVGGAGSNISGVTLASNLADNNVTILSSAGTTGGAGNVNVNESVTWGANTNLTLTASNNINVNSNILATGATAGLSLNSNTANGTELASGSGTLNIARGSSISLPNVSSAPGAALKLNGVAYSVINTLGAQGSTSGTDLQGLSATGHYALGSSIDALSTSTWSGGKGFTPITGFTGVLNGMGHSINNLTINRPAESYVGLFGAAAGVITNLGVVNPSITGSTYVGSIVGSLNLAAGDFSYNYSTGGFVKGADVGTYIGGLAGFAAITAGDFKNNYSTTSVGIPGTGTFHGGLVGEVAITSGNFKNNYATGDVTGGTYQGGLVGIATVTTGNFTDNYATGKATGTTYVGGLVGAMTVTTGTFSDNYATGNAWGTTYVGGLLGASTVTTGSFLNSYATGRADGTTGAGGLVGTSTVTTGNFSNNYASGVVTGAAPGGLTGASTVTTGALTNSFWNTETSGIAATAGSIGTGVTTVQLAASPIFSAWDTSKWLIIPGQLPILRSVMTPLIVTATNATKTYDGLAYNGSAGVTYSITPDFNFLSVANLAYTTQSGNINAGAYAIAPTGLVNTTSQSGYNITYVPGTLVVNKANAVVTANSGSGTYTGVNQTVTGFSASNLVNSETAAVLTGVSASGTGKDAGSYASTAIGTDKNYNLSFQAGSLEIAKANAVVTANSGSGTYTGVNQTVTGFSASNLVNSETAAVLTGVSASGTGKDAGSYASTAIGTDKNYNLSFQAGSLEIAKANAVVTSNNLITTYDGTQKNLSGYVVKDTNGKLIIDTLGVSDIDVSAINVGSSILRASGMLPNYNLKFTDGVLQITPAPLVITAASSTSIYNGAIQSNTGATVSGLVGSDSVSNLAITTSGSRQNVGTTVTNAMANGTIASNYSITYVAGGLVITPASVTVTADSAAVLYDGAIQYLNTYTASGMVGKERTSVLTGITAGGSGTNVGLYVNTLSGGTNPNYNITFVNGILSIIPATPKTGLTSYKATLIAGSIVLTPVNTMMTSSQANGALSKTPNPTSGDLDGMTIDTPINLSDALNHNPAGSGMDSSRGVKETANVSKELNTISSDLNIALENMLRMLDSKTLVDSYVSKTLFSPPTVKSPYDGFIKFAMDNQIGL
ncbi:filamentous hemagglutinin family protein [Polynucleobacter brandtiae]|uniref:Filamentous hemagglutinin family protein n=1 Tax=Polynucleobacter brandtiae TaxID=1938816 RepID=A0A2M8VJ41_9BURK|nr:filamentous hemagglutinin N-terminal domain-containing protein [Polynucleobacter brandtiae]PJI76948.1 filamentous hemagglutinin family protein [Polynucleobacter brandtiae]